ncbi:hypothetical protein [Melghirimyces algeriensis]|uniref:Uncharacterized protein n=1 Tax=Melghirimyces algeriensis TaxID=910412 RepID=A0A521B1A8_9BACL|nr:hypothetical protein [Melghirimyces algeriensis]SMO40836.1 hypothetical protein SAMN06264849_101469 [Melghirimyces algeriensis]
MNPFIRPIAIRLVQGRKLSKIQWKECSFQQKGVDSRHKLRMLQAFHVRFIRGPRDRSLWRDAGRREQLGRTMTIDRPAWNDRVTMMSQSPSGMGKR